MNKQFYIFISGLLCIFMSSCHTIKRTQFKNTLTKELAATTAEKNKLNYLLNKNDSLWNGGLTYDSASQQLNQEIKMHLAKTDAAAAALQQLFAKVNFRVAFLEEYNDVKKDIQITAAAKKSKEEIYSLLDTRINESLIAGEKKALKTILNSAADQQKKEAGAIAGIGNKKDSLLSSGIVDSTTSSNIDARLIRYRARLDSFKNEINDLTVKLESPADTRKEFSYIKARILLVDSVVNKNAAVREYTLQMIEDGLSKPTKKLFNLAAFFGPGGYIIPKDKYPIAREYFLPIVDSLLKFSNNYPALLRTASIMIEGYADATKISANTPLYKTLAAFMHRKAPSKQELNTGLSALRAIEIRQFLDMLIKEKTAAFISIDKVTFFNFESGMGEILPDPDIKNYTVNDERRRIVLIYWSVLPN
jgi:disulfide oxidoreductase YuzD